MKPHLIGFVAAGVLAAACISPQERAMTRPGAAITTAEGVKAFSDAVLGHCLPAIHTGQSFADFEVAGVTPLSRLQENKISQFADETLPVWQMVEGVVQVQLDEAGGTCRVVAYGLPVKATFKLVGDAAIQTDYGYSDEDAGFPQEGPGFTRTLFAGTGDNQVTLTLTGVDPEEDVEGEYATLNAVVTKGAD